MSDWDWVTTAKERIAAATVDPPKWAVDAGIKCYRCHWGSMYFQTDITLIKRGEEHQLGIVLGLPNNYIDNERGLIRGTYRDTYGLHIFVGNDPICYVMPLPRIIDSMYALNIVKQELQALLNGERGDWSNRNRNYKDYDDEGAY